MNEIQDLRISIVQHHLHWENIEANLNEFDQLIKPLQNQTDLIILPEMFTTGFSMNPRALAEKMDGPSVNWMKEKAAQLNAVLCGSLIIEDNGQFFNRMLCLFPDGTTSVYDKRHLFTLAKEHEHYSPGSKRLIIYVKGWKIMPLICYDLRFPVWSRNDLDYDLLFYAANWPKPRRNAWKTLLQARAIENQVYTIGVNRIGEDGTGAIYTGDSCLVDYTGEPRFTASQEPAVFTTTLSYEAQQKFRNKLQFLSDKDVFEIK